MKAPDDHPYNLPPIPEPIQKELDALAQLCKEKAELQGRILVLESQLKFNNAATAAALDDLNRQLDSAKRERSTSISDARRSRAEAATLVTALATLLDLMHVEKPEDMTPERAAKLVKAQKEAHEVLHLYYENHD